MTLTVLTISQWFNAWNVRSEHQSVIHTANNNRWLVLGVFAAFALHIFAIYTPFMQEILRTTGLTLIEWLIIAVASLSVILAEEIRKYFARRSLKKNSLQKSGMQTV